MIFPDIKTEKELFSQGERIIIGIDEVGRGPLAGPVVAGAAWVNPKAYENDFDGRELIRDSKLLSPKQREKACEIILSNDDFVVGIGECSHAIVDRVNILQATFLAMRFAIEELLDKLKVKNKRQEEKSKTKDTGYGLEDMNKETSEDKIILLLDGNRKIPKVNYEQHLFPRGDKHIFSIAAASICAKVYRDKLMDEYHEKYPAYGFDQHKGYGTQLHIECLKKHGPCKIHRLSFSPVTDLILNQSNGI